MFYHFHFQRIIQKVCLLLENLDQLSSLSIYFVQNFNTPFINDSNKIVTSLGHIPFPTLLRKHSNATFNPYMYDINIIYRVFFIRLAWHDLLNLSTFSSKLILSVNSASRRFMKSSIYILSSIIFIKTFLYFAISCISYLILLLTLFSILFFDVSGLLSFFLVSGLLSFFLVPGLLSFFLVSSLLSFFLVSFGLLSFLVSGLLSFLSVSSLLSFF